MSDIARFCQRAERCSYGKTHNPCDLHEGCIGFVLGREKALNDFKAKKTEPPKEKKNKFGAIKTTVDGIVFDSKLESERYKELKYLEKSGEISGLQRQVEFVLIPKSEYGRTISYVADFTYTQDGKFIVEDTKSKATKTAVYRLKKRLVAEKYKILIHEVER